MPAYHVDRSVCPVPMPVVPVDPKFHSNMPVIPVDPKFHDPMPVLPAPDCYKPKTPKPPIDLIPQPLPLFPPNPQPLDKQQLVPKFIGEPKTLQA